MEQQPQLDQVLSSHGIDDSFLHVSKTSILHFRLLMQRALASRSMADAMALELTPSVINEMRDAHPDSTLLEATRYFIGRFNAALVSADCTNDQVECTDALVLWLAKGFAAGIQYACAHGICVIAGATHAMNIVEHMEPKPA